MAPKWESGLSDCWHPPPGVSCPPPSQSGSVRRREVTHAPLARRSEASTTGSFVVRRCVASRSLMTHTPHSAPPWASGPPAGELWVCPHLRWGRARRPRGEGRAAAPGPPSPAPGAGSRADGAQRWGRTGGDAARTSGPWFWGCSSGQNRLKLRPPSCKRKSPNAGVK